MILLYLSYCSLFSIFLPFCFCSSVLGKVIFFFCISFYFPYLFTVLFCSTCSTWVCVWSLVYHMYPLLYHFIFYNIITFCFALAVITLWHHNFTCQHYLVLCFIVVTYFISIFIVISTWWRYYFRRKKISLLSLPSYCSTNIFWSFP